MVYFPVFTKYKYVYFLFYVLHIFWQVTSIKEKEAKRIYIYYLTTFIGLRERGSEGIACPKGGLSPLNGYPNIVHRPIGRFVVSERGRRWLLTLGLLLHHRAVPALPFRHAVRFARSHSTSLRLRPAVGYPEQRRSGFRLSDSSLLSPSAVRSPGAIKREESDHVGAAGFFISERRLVSFCMSFLVSLLLIRRQSSGIILKHAIGLYDIAVL